LNDKIDRIKRVKVNPADNEQSKQNVFNTNSWIAKKYKLAKVPRPNKGSSKAWVTRLLNRL
jgi:hypothetical protein